MNRLLCHERLHIRFLALFGLGAEGNVIMQCIRDMLKQRSTLVFFLLTFGLSWAVWAPMMLLQVDHPIYKLGTFGPMLAALLLTLINGGKAGIRALLKRLLIWRVSVGWYLFSFLSTAAVALMAIALHVRLGGEAPKFNDPAQWYLVIPVFLYVLFLSVLGEEIGWRGFALPRLQTRYGALGASLILGVVWGFWHLPLFWMKGDFHHEIPVTLFLLNSVALSILYTWMFNHTRGSLLMPHLFHAASNTTLGVLPILPMDTGGDTRPMWLAVGLLWMFAIAIVVSSGPMRRGVVCGTLGVQDRAGKRSTNRKRSER